MTAGEAREELAVRVAAAEHLDAEEHRWCATHPSPRVRRRWARRPDQDPELVLERVAAETDTATLAHLATKAYVVLAAPHLLEHRSALVVASAAHHANDCDAAQALGRILRTGRGHRIIAAHLAVLARRDQLLDRPLVVATSLELGDAWVLVELAGHLREDDLDSHRAYARRVRDLSESAPPLDLIRRWAAPSQVLEDLLPALQPWAEHGTDGRTVAIRSWLTPDTETLRTLTGHTERAHLFTFAGHTAHLAHQQEHVRLLGWLHNDSDAPAAAQSAARLGRALMRNDHLDPDLRTTLLQSDPDLFTDWADRLGRATLTAPAAARAWSTVADLGGALGGPVVAAARDLHALTAVRAAGAPDRLTLAHPAAPVQWALEAPAQIALRHYHDPRALRRLLEQHHGPVADRFLNAGRVPLEHLPAVLDGLTSAPATSIPKG